MEKNLCKIDKNLVLSHKRYYLRTLKVEDVNDKYLGWLNDKEVTEYLEIRYKRYTLESLRDYVRSFKTDDSKFLFGVFSKENDEHIGNGTIYNINYFIGTFDIGYLIGEKQYWGKEAGSETLLMLLKFGFEDLGLRKFFGGIYSNHVKGRFVLQKIGFKQEARLSDRFLFEGKPIDQIIYSMDRKQWKLIKEKYDI